MNPVSALSADRFTRRRFLQQISAAGVGAAMAPVVRAARRGNLIEQENARSGTTDWLLTSLEPAAGTDYDALCQRRRAIEAFCSHTSIRPGEVLKVYVSTDPPARFQADLFRMGWYGGKGGRLVQSLRRRQGAAQSTPTDGVRNLVECRWKESFEVRIPRS